ncbi:hypothetical protein SY83_03560 [Paenibacillus swuensis]|uniref:Uncharacterized protein n=1 Tax=Paenibacillus swuensis TaxID=1178515 RepID=A0A172TF82_9BACL|nr:hypothetical protein [Paenibacillus swuensis]ANE45537.1 hypothetical protein SY83_03560 [Paenibacillus swuensis]
MRNAVPLVNSILLVVYILLSRSEVSVPDFVEGALIGLILAGSIYSIFQFSKNRGKKLVG